MQYQVQRGDTIAKVTQLLNTRWKTLRRMNSHAIGRSSRTGHWFLKEGATVTVKASFQSVLQQKVDPDKPSETMNVGPKVHKPCIEYIIKPGDTLWALAVKTFHVNLEDLIRENNIQNPRALRPGRKIRIPVYRHGPTQEVVASWYGKNYHGRTMANGNPFDMHANTIAHRELPLGTTVELTNPKTGQREKAVVTDRGPYVPGRDVDLSYGLAQKLSMVRQGVGKLIMKAI